MTQASTLLSQRFRGYYPVVIDVETAGFNAQTDALLEIAATLLTMDADFDHLNGAFIQVQKF